MSRAAADRWVIVSAVTVAGIYALTKWKDTNSTPPATFLTAWGVVYFTLALVSTASAPLGGSMAILVMTADLLGNTPGIDRIVKAAGIGQTKATTPAAPAHPAAPATAGSVPVPPVSPAAPLEVHG